MVSKASAKPAVQQINWTNIDNLADARAALGVVVNISELLGDGSTFFDDKSVFVGKPFLILEWHFIEDQKTEREYVNVLIMGANGDKARFNDGSTGIYKQLKQITEEAGVIGLEVKGGLRKSDYTFEKEDGTKGSATTYYLSY
jgi:hypothetical protein